MMRNPLVLALLAFAGACSSGTEPSDPTVPASIVLTPDSIQTFPDRATGVPTAVVYNGSHQVIPTPVTWHTGNTAVATMYGNTGVFGKTIGNTTIVATAGSVSQAAKLSIVREPVASVIIIPGYAALNGRDSLKMYAVAAGESLDSIPGRVITWSTHNPGLISVSASGMVHAVGTGTGYVIATCEGKSDSAAVLADARLVAKIVVIPGSLNMFPGTHSDGWTHHVYDASNNELGRTLTWSSSDPTIATADESGAVALRTGTVTLTARADTASVDVPVSIAPIAFTTVSAGGSGNACGLTATQEAYCWGGNGLGQLGTTTYGYAGNPAPAPVLGGLHFATIAAGTDWTCALAVSGAPYCWGGQDFVGDGSWTPKAVSGPTLVSLNNIGNRACGLDAAGTAWCWGANDFGNLFTPPTGCSPGADCRWAAVATGNGKHWSMVSAGDGWHICGIDTGGSTQCWGVNASGQLGDNTLTDESLPTPVQGGLAFVEVSAGEATSCGLTAGGDAYCWGSDLYGVLGTGVAMPSCTAFNPCSKLPLAVAGGHKFTHVTVAVEHACALTAAGAVWCWGFSVNGDGTPTVPSAVAGSITFVSISVGGNNCGMATDGLAYCWRRLETPARVPGQQ